MRPFALAVVLLPAVALFGAVPAAAPAFADDPVVVITLKDHQFVPTEVAVPAGVKVQLLVKNEQPAPAEFESRVLHFEKVVTAGGQVAVFVGPLSPGSYEFYDDFHNATRGHLVVK
ncbi:MAG TPA: cupredoxin domain-containing protein [Stellaceae bacterium]|nr:cupredoxin domain-containing protein [Stellaceae bacterium]